MRLKRTSHKLESNPPLSPFVKRGNVTRRSAIPLFDKEGQGEIYSTDFGYTTLEGDEKPGQAGQKDLRAEARENAMGKEHGAKGPEREPLALCA